MATVCLSKQLTCKSYPATREGIARLMQPSGASSFLRMKCSLSKSQAAMSGSGSKMPSVTYFGLSSPAHSRWSRTSPFPW